MSWRPGSDRAEFSRKLRRPGFSRKSCGAGFEDRAKQVAQQLRGKDRDGPGAVIVGRRLDPVDPDAIMASRHALQQFEVSEGAADQDFPENPVARASKTEPSRLRSSCAARIAVDPVRSSSGAASTRSIPTPSRPRDAPCSSSRSAKALRIRILQKIL
jgi:hypothetical protein